MRNCDIKFVNKEITPFGGLSLFFKMLEKCHFEEHVMQSGVPLQGSNRGYKPIQLILGQTGQLDEAKKTLKALIADVPYSNKKLACMDMEERYRLIISSILNAIGFRVDVERMMANGRIDIIASSNIYM